MIYLDNSASSFYKPDCVVNAVRSALVFFPANSGRSGHGEAIKGAKLVESTRRRIMDFCGLKNGCAIFTDNCTGALNLAILGGLSRGHLVTSVFEHNSVLRPLYELSKRNGNVISFAKPSSGLTLKSEDIIKLIRPDTTAVVLTHVSNVTGECTPLEFIGRECKKRGILFIVDGAQSVGHASIDMDRCNIDMLAVAPHKGLHAIQGLGVLLVREGVPLRPIKWGGTGSASSDKNQPSFLPDGAEAGTLPLPAIAALSASMGWCEKNFYRNKRTVRELHSHLIDALSQNDKIKIYGEGSRSGILTFNLRGVPSTTVANLLSSEYDVCVRAGLHCAPLAHAFLGTQKTGAVRVSLGCNNTLAEIDFLINAINELCR